MTEASGAASSEPLEASGTTSCTEASRTEASGTEASGTETSAAAPTTPDDAPQPSTSADHSARARRARLGAAAVASSLVLALGLHGSDPAAPSAAAPAADPEPAVTAAAATAATAATAAALIDSSDRAIAAARTDRSLNRARFAPQQPEPEPEIVGKRYSTVDLNVRTKPDEDAKVVTVLDPGDKVPITDVKEDGWRQVVYKDKTRWVKSAYLSKNKPKPKPKPKGPSSEPCPGSSGGSGMESGLTGNAIKVHRAVCAAFPSVTAYGGVRGGGGNHGSGHAVDIMVSGGSGDAIAAYVRAHAAKLGVTEVIWQQQIWTTQRASEGWRSMSDRGSATANHYDHVHVTVR